MAQSPGRGDLTSSAGSRLRVTGPGLSGPSYEAINLVLTVVCCACGYVGNALALSTYPQGPAYAARSVAALRRLSSAQWRDDNLPIGRHGADLNCQARVRRRAPHGAEHACRGIIPPVADGVHAAARRRRKGRPGCSCALAARRRYGSAAAATAARFTAPAAVRGRPGIRLSAPPAGATRRAAAVG